MQHVGVPERVQRLLAQQCGVVSRGQAMEAGMTHAAIRAQLAGARWQRLHPGTYAGFTGVPSWESRCWAGLLYCGDGAMLSHHTAAALAGFGHREGPIHVTVPAHRRVAAQPGLIVHSSTRCDVTRHPVLRPPSTRVEETALDLVAISRNLDGALAVVAEACRLRVTAPDRLMRTLTSRPTIRWRRDVAAVLSDVAAGAQSALELHYLGKVERPHGLPRGTRQRRTLAGQAVRYSDVAYEEFGTVVELDGRLGHHDARSAWRDLERDNALSLAGELTLRYGWRDVLGRPCAVARQVAHALRRRGWSGTPRPCGPSCATQ